MHLSTPQFAQRAVDSFLEHASVRLCFCSFSFQFPFHPWLNISHPYRRECDVLHQLGVSVISIGAGWQSKFLISTFLFRYSIFTKVILSHSQRLIISSANYCQMYTQERIFTIKKSFWHAEGANYSIAVMQMMLTCKYL